MQSIIKDKYLQLRQLCQEYNVRVMYAFGSACTDEFTDESDIDPLVSFDDISIDQYTDNYFELHRKLSSLFSRKVDLITENSISNPYFIRSIEGTKQLVYEN